jgi:serine/threonine-protein kinase
VIDVGRRVRDYEIVAHLKPGGMATLFLARRVGPQGFARPVAIKIVHPHLASDPELVRMFIDEARLSACVHHPNVVHVEELGEENGTFFLAMEYLHGESLSALLAALSRVERQLPVDVAAWIAMQAAAGLHAAHETRDAEGRPLGLVHRDVSPQNVLVSVDGHVKLIDFGIVKVGAASGGTEAGVIKGKLAYMAPEQAEGDHVDRRTDVYALGIVLWEMLAMRRLFSGASDVEVLDRVRRPVREAPSAHRPDVPAALEAAVLRALAPDPGDRFATAEDFQRALARSVPEAAAAGSALAAILREMIGDRIEGRRRALAAAPPPETSVGRWSPPAAPPEPLEPDAPTIASRSGVHAIDTRAVAVMPLRAFGNVDAMVVDGVGDELRDLLSRVRGLRVKARAAPRGHDEDASAYGERLGVGRVVTGRVQQPDPERVRLAIALTSVEDGFQIWAEKFDCAMEELLETTDRVAQAIANALGDARLRGERPDGDPEAVDLHLELRRVISQPILVDPEAPFVLLERAKKIAPRDAVVLAFCAIGAVRSTYRPGSRREAMDVARATAERAVELGPDLPEPWVAMGQVRYGAGDSPGAVRALRRAIANGPSVCEAHELLGRMLLDAGLVEEAQRILEQALWIDPDRTFAFRELVRLYALEGEWGSVERGLARLAALDREQHLIMAVRLSLWAGRPLADPATGATSAKHVAALAEIGWSAIRSRALREKDVATIRRVRESFVGQLLPQRFFRQLEAEFHAFVGNRDGAMELVHEAAEAGLEDRVWIDRCPLIAPYAREPALERDVEAIRARAEEVRRAWDEW